MLDALKLMRIPFSVYLMPIFWFSVSTADSFSTTRALGIFLIIHLLVYPASNGYNSYFDKDEGSIGGLKNPPNVNKSLFWLVVIFDLLAIGMAFLLSAAFAACITIYLLVSKAYSYDKIRLKKYPIISTLVVIFFQGAFTFIMVQVGLGYKTEYLFRPQNLVFAAVSSLFLCGSYPITQIYQHEEDARRGDKTLSLLLGIKGTLLFAAISLLVASAVLGIAYFKNQQLQNMFIFLVCTAPVVVFFSQWFWKVTKNPDEANFENTMRMNKTSSLSISLAFILMILWS
ncbi:UbiA family prenyltransferase [Adhaeribacter aquaticus]|uniref:UbiA family prenyltransferase n=1 Tax=Adhaeribacter aquaticus TaxID=299567 RepID=UPI00041807B0|nr:UbiA family prenyltransferase [Adhaeribacter aquaticus]